MYVICFAEVWLMNQLRKPQENYPLLTVSDSLTNSSIGSESYITYFLKLMYVSIGILILNISYVFVQCSFITTRIVWSCFIF